MLGLGCQSHYGANLAWAIWRSGGSANLAQSGGELSGQSGGRPNLANLAGVPIWRHTSSALWARTPLDDLACVQNADYKQAAYAARGASAARPPLTAQPATLAVQPFGQSSAVDHEVSVLSKGQEAGKFARSSPPEFV